MEKYLNIASMAITDIDELIDGREDIDDNGNANMEMNIHMELEKLRFCVVQIRQQLANEIKAKDLKQ
jgi:hypothetical protein